MAKKYNKSKKFHFSREEQKAYWMGVGAGELVRANPKSHTYDLPLWKVQDLGTKAVKSYEKGFSKKYRSFE